LIFAASIAIALLAFAALSGIAAHYLTKPQRHPISRAKSPDRSGIQYEDVDLKSHVDGLSIKGWYLPSIGSSRAVILVHGKDSSRTAEFDRDPDDRIPGEFPDLGFALVKRGFTVLMIDLRGHGESSDARFSFGKRERLDIRRAVDYLETKGFKPGRIGVLGVSMGAASAIGAASEDDRIGALVADSSFAELAPLVESHWTTTTHLPSFLLPSTRFLAKHAFDCDIESARPVDEISKVQSPILLIHGDKDPVTPLEHAKRLESSAKGRARLWIGQTNRHAGIYFVDPQRYIDEVVEFYKSNL
jgi:pimeloyl-ACP methyl ester carboxylesterase